MPSEVANPEAGDGDGDVEKGIAKEDNRHLDELCAIESKKIERWYKLSSLIELLFFDALLEIINETSDILLAIQLQQRWARRRDPEARYMFVASLCIICLELLVRGFTGLFDLSRPWVPIERCNEAPLKRPRRRKLKKKTHPFLYFK